MAQTVLRSLLADLHALERIDDTTEYEPGVAFCAAGLVWLARVLRSVL